jgi:L-iditol 2-dehydrogenase
MIAAVFRGPGELKAEEVEYPEIGPEEVLIKVGANTLCGTDLRLLRGEKTGLQIPTILGHEFAGRVADVGSRVKGYKLGDLVAVAPKIPCRRCYYCWRDMENNCTDPCIMGYGAGGGLGEYVRVPAQGIEAGNLFAVEEGVSFEYLALAEPLSCCINGHHRTRIEVNDTVLIMGSGAIGVFHLQLSLLAGAGTVIVSEPSQSRREFARKLGAHVTVDPTTEDLASIVNEKTGGIGADATIICIGMPHLVNDAFGITRKGGRVNIFAGLAGTGWAEVEANLIHYKELEVTGTSDSRRRDYEVALRLIESGRIDVESMVTHRFSLAAVEEALDAAASGEGVKVAVMP